MRQSCQTLFYVEIIMISICSVPFSDKVADWIPVVLELSSTHHFDYHFCTMLWNSNVYLISKTAIHYFIIDIVLYMSYFCTDKGLIFYFYPQVISLFGRGVLTITNTTIKSYKIAVNITLTAIKKFRYINFPLMYQT